MAKKQDAPALIPEAEQPYPIPENWRWKKWGNMGEFVAGSGFKKEYQGFTNYSIPFYKVGSLKFSDSSGYIDDNTNTINEIIRNYLKAYLIPSQSILFAKIGEAIRVNRRSITRIPCCIDNNLMAFIPQKCLMRYAYYWSYTINLYDYMNATIVPSIRKSDLQEIPFPLPPLAEQQRIVDCIESLFAKLDAARDKAQAVLDGYEQCRAAILHRAFTGELTAKWRAEHGVDLNSWKQIKLIDCLKERPRNGYSPKPVNYVTPYKSMTLSATTSGVFLPQFFKYIDETIPDDSYLWLAQGDILIQRANSIDKVGTSAIYTGKHHEFIYPDLMMKLRIQNNIDANFIAYYLKTSDSMDYFRKNAVGTAGNMPKINQKIVSDLPVVLPSVAEQTAIVKILNNLFFKEQWAKEAAEIILSRIDMMKKAILGRAFRGQLGTNDPSERAMM